MWHAPDNDHFTDEVYLAGERVSAGIYRKIGNGFRIRLDDDGVLPASLDGRVACYIRETPRWEQTNRQTTTNEQARAA